ncbi:MAG: malate dehydrogenase [Actinobacteria bacterium]|nr:malate dehydrogenase [Actinomycetota bacterium]
MPYVTAEKVAVLGAAGAVGSNLAQSLLATGTASTVAMYDPYAQGLEGAAEEICHCAFPDARVTWTTDIAAALDGAAYVASSGGAPRKEGMTREDLLRGNAEIAARLGRDIRAHAPNAKLVVIVFNPADITGLVTLVTSGLAPARVTTLAALDSTRVQTKLAQHFRVPQHTVTGCRTYGGHGQEMALFKGAIRIGDVPLVEILDRGRSVNGVGLTRDGWAEIRGAVVDGGARIIKLRGRSSFQSPGHLSARMVGAAAGGSAFEWPCGAYVTGRPYARVMMAMPATLGPDGVRWSLPTGDTDEQAELDAAYLHLETLRDETIAMGILPPVAEWPRHNPHLA